MAGKKPDVASLAEASAEIVRGRADSMRNLFASMGELYKTKKLMSLEPALPALLKLKGKPLTLDKHFPMRPLFDLAVSRETVVQSGRQISKSTTLAELMIVLGGMVPFLQLLYVAPLSEQTRNFSVNYIKPFLSYSPIRHVLVDPTVEQNVFQRTFLNGSIHQYSFAFFDAERIRGKPSDIILRDEYQDLDTAFDPIIDETSSASPYKIKFYTGTAKTLDTALTLRYEKSSQGVWATRCTACGKWNLATVSMGLLDMIQREGLGCRHCLVSKNKFSPLRPETGQWVHGYPERYYERRGFQCPQVIFPMHYDPDPATGLMTSWADIYRAKQDGNRVSFLNEKLGEPADFRVALLTRRDLEKASVLPHRNNLQEALRKSKTYREKILALDWGGGGESGISLTKAVVLGCVPGNRLDVLYMEAFNTMAGHIEEATRALSLFKAFGCYMLAHDYRGSGDLRETLLIQQGFPMAKLFNAQYVTTSARDLVLFHPPSDSLSRYYWSVDRTRSLVLTCAAIRNGYVRFPRFDSWETTHMADFLALVENMRETETRGSIMTIGRKGDQSDDMAHALNIGAIARWHSVKSYPDVGKDLFKRYTISEDIERALKAAEAGAREDY